MTTTTHCGPAGASTPDALEPAFRAAVAAGDLEAVVGLYAADAVVSLPRGREAAGSAAIRAAFAAALAAGVLQDWASVAGSGAGEGDEVAPTVRAVVSGDLAMTTASGVDGRVCTQVARRSAEGRWLWVRDGSRLRDVEACLPTTSHHLVVA
ncbi:nuclear transport factor 2 family protein [Terrabacter sp. NPDC080008]|uniref:nuclear transport factor 2 family protein n=1 Tax=Terrabacter sp. NPDC080008 TaxID=3155176 RepID=UPI00344FD690